MVLSLHLLIFFNVDNILRRYLNPSFHQSSRSDTDFRVTAVLQMQRKAGNVLASGAWVQCAAQWLEGR